MYATRLLAALIAAAAGTVAAGAAVGAALLVSGRLWHFDLMAHGSGHALFRLATGIFVPTFVVVMVAVFRVLERTGLVGEPPTSHNPLGLNDMPPEARNTPRDSSRGANRR